MKLGLLVLRGSQEIRLAELVYFKLDSINETGMAIPASLLQNH